MRQGTTITRFSLTTTISSVATIVNCILTTTITSIAMFVIVTAEVHASVCSPRHLYMHVFRSCS